MQALDICLEVYGEYSILTSRIYINVGIVHEDNHDFIKAYDYFLKWAHVNESVLGPEHPKTLRARCVLKEPRYHYIASRLKDLDDRIVDDLDQNNVVNEETINFEAQRLDSCTDVNSYASGGFRERWTARRSRAGFGRRYEDGGDDAIRVQRPVAGRGRAAEDDRAVCTACVVRRRERGRAPDLHRRRRWHGGTTGPRVAESIVELGITRQQRNRISRTFRISCGRPDVEERRQL